MERVSFWSVFLRIFIPVFLIFTWILFDSLLSGRYGLLLIIIHPFSLSLIGIFLGLGFIWAAIKYYGEWQKSDLFVFKIERQPMNITSECTIGSPCQIEGVIESINNNTINTPDSKIPCVAYYYNNGAGYERFRSIPFKVVDKFGDIIVDLSEIEFSKREGKGNEFLQFTSSKGEIDLTPAIIYLDYHRTSNDKNVKIQELGFLEGQKVFVNGWGVEKNGLTSISVNPDTPFVLSIKSKKELIETFQIGESYFIYSNLLIFIGGLLSFFGIIYFFGFSWIALLPMAIFTFLLIIRLILVSYNRVVELENRCDNSRSQIDIELKKRFELIPLLEELVKVHANYEKNIQVLLTQVRSGIETNFSNESVLKYSAQNESFKKEIYLITENYPEIKSQPSFISLFKKIVVIENNISSYKEFYNKTATTYNSLIISVPFFVFAIIRGYKQKLLLS